MSQNMRDNIDECPRHAHIYHVSVSLARYQRRGAINIGGRTMSYDSSRERTMMLRHGVISDIFAR